MSGDPYVYPGIKVLRNKFGIDSVEELERAERLLTTKRGKRNVPHGDFDLAHLKAIHRHLFQDIYDWAGEIRTVEISKGSSQFMFRRFIESGMADVHRRIVVANYFAGLSKEDFAAAAGEIMGDVNYVHPFREGNGRVQLLYLKQFCERAGHPLDLHKIGGAAWMAASVAANRADYGPMGEAILAGLERRRVGIKES